LSADGRYAAFSSLADDIVPNDTNQTFDGFVRDLATETTRRISVDRFGNELAADQSLDALIVVISADGKYVAWDSEDDNVVPGDNNGGTTDAFVRSLILPAVDTVQPGVIAAGASLTFTVTGSGFRPGVAAGFAGNSQLAVTSVSFVSETEIDVNVTAAADAAAGGRTMFVFNPGSGPGSLATNFALCPCVTVTLS
jgi:hypothetical protein